MVKHINKKKNITEKKTVRTMIEMFCEKHHPKNKGLCPECMELFKYAESRIEKCPFRENKPPCSKCTIHCYKPAMKEKIIPVMKYSGPRMLFKHPILALKHISNHLAIGSKMW